MNLVDIDSIHWSAFKDDHGREYARYLVTHLPTIDAVPVVRCKDCKYFDSSPTSDGGFICYCRHDDGLCDWIKEDYYCCFGERKEDSND